MAKYKSTGSISQNYMVTAGGPLDTRQVVDSKSDLLDLKTFNGGLAFGDYRYAGMVVSVVGDSVDENNGVYYLVDFEKRNVEDGWEKIGSRGGNVIPGIGGESGVLVNSTQFAIDGDNVMSLKIKKDGGIASGADGIELDGNLTYALNCNE